MKRLTLIALASLAAAPVSARQPPNPPPSGIVVHLFGPDSVASGILPGAPATLGAATAAPSGSDILHQMFVTGDPAQENGAALAKGKAGAAKP